MKHIIQTKEEKLKNKFGKELLNDMSSIFIPLKDILYHYTDILLKKYFPHYKKWKTHNQK